MNLSVFVEVFQGFQHLLQDAGDAGLIQHPGLMLPTGDDVLDDVQHRAWSTEKGVKGGGIRVASCTVTVEPEGR